MSIRKIVLSLFFSKYRHRWQQRWRDVKTGRFIKGNMFRVTFGVKYLPIGNVDRFRCSFHAWKNERFSDEEIDRLWKIFVIEVRNFCGYPEEEWWFDVFQETNRELKLIPKYLGKWKFKVWNRLTDAIEYERDGKLD